MHVSALVLLLGPNPHEGVGQCGKAAWSCSSYEQLDHTVFLDEFGSLHMLCCILTFMYLILYSYAIDIVLHSNFLKDPYILCWDIRKAVDVVYK